MSYTVLARKLRPDQFSALVGQEHVVRALTHGLDHDRLHHAYLFTGTRGVGKTTIARVLAKSLNCEQGVSSNPCGACSHCTAVAENRFVDLIEVDAASRTGIDDTRELLENAQYLPTVGRYKVYLIDEVHMLSKAAFNALLKTLEEPPEHVKFLLATTDPKKVPVTVLSRCLQFQLKNLSSDLIEDYLAKVLVDESIEFDAAALALLGRAAQGSMRDALSLTDQAIAFGQGSVMGSDVAEMLGAVGRDEIGALMQALSAGNAAELLGLVEELAARSADFADVLAGIIEAFHGLAVQQSLGEPIAVQFAPEEVQLNYQIGVMGLKDLTVVPDPRLAFEMTLLRMLAFAPADALRGAGTMTGTTTGTTTGAKTSTEAGTEAGNEAGSKTGHKADTTQADQSINSMPAAELQPQVEPKQANAEAKTPDKGRGRQRQAQDPQPLAAAQPMPDQQDWYALAHQLKLSGVARMLVEHCLCVNAQVLGTPAASNTPLAIQLALDPAHDTLLGDQQVNAVQLALAQCLGCAVTLSMVPMAGDAETPSKRSARLAAERQAQAEQSLHSDSTVQSLLAEFDGKVEQVVPIEISPSNPA